MIRRFAVAAFALFVAGTTWAADPPENLLPASTQLYLRWDGIRAHQAAYDQSARGKMFAGDTGNFSRELGQFVLDRLRDEVFGKKLSDGVPPEELEKINADLRTVIGLPALLADHGL